MKHIYFAAMVFSALLGLQACGHKQANTVETADSANIVKDTTMTMAVDKDDSDFAVEAASGGMAEVVLGKLALEKGKSKKVKNFGAMMVKDHSKANIKLMALAKDKNIALPPAPGADEQKIIADLSKRSGGDFDKAYVSAMIDDHKEDIKKFTAASKSLQDPELKTFAIKTLPTLQTHLDAINAIHDSMK